MRDHLGHMRERREEERRREEREEEEEEEEEKYGTVRGGHTSHLFLCAMCVSSCVSLFCVLISCDH